MLPEYKSNVAPETPIQGAFCDPEGPEAKREPGASRILTVTFVAPLEVLQEIVEVQVPPLFKLHGLGLAEIVPVAPLTALYALTLPFDQYVPVPVIASAVEVTL